MAVTKWLLQNGCYKMAVTKWLVYVGRQRINIPALLSVPFASTRL
jgi:hypothetical protein